MDRSSLGGMMRRTAAALILMMFAAAAIAAAPAASPKPKPKHTPPAVIEPPAGAWKTDISNGIQGTISREKPSLVLISAAWCPYCKKIKNNILPDAAVQDSLKNWDLTYIDLDTYPKCGQELQNRSIPFFVMYDKDGNEISRFNHEMDSAQVKAWIDDVYSRAIAIEKIDEQLKANAKDAKLLGEKASGLMDLALKLHSVNPRITVTMPTRIARCLDVYKQAVAAGNTDPELKAKAELVQAVEQVVGATPAAGTPKLAELENGNSAIAGDASFWMAVATMRQKETKPWSGHDPESDQMFRTYAERNPNGRYADTTARRVAVIKSAEAKEAQKAAQPNK